MLLTGFGRLEKVSVQIFGIISSFLSNRWLRVVLDMKSLQEYSVNAGVSQVGSWSYTFQLYINVLPDDVISNVAIYADDTTLYSYCDQWVQLICGNN